MGICICWNVYLHLLECGAAAVRAAAIEASHWSTEHDGSTNQNQECYRTNTIINSKEIQIQVKIQIQREEKTNTDATPNTNTLKHISQRRLDQ